MNDIAAVSINLAPIRDATGMNISGVIGTNILRHFRVFISYRDSIAVFSDDSGDAKTPAFSIPMDYSLSTSFLPLVRGSISLGKKKPSTVRLAVDNGLNAWLLLPKSFIGKYNVPDSLIVKSSGETFQDAFKRKNISLVRVPELHIGPITLQDIPAYVSDFKYPLIGKRILERFNFMMDYPSKRTCFFSIPDSAKVSFEKHPCGTGLISKKASNGKIVVNGIWKGSQGDLSGIGIGDTITALQDSSAQALSALAVNGILNEDSPRDSVGVTVKRANGNQLFLHIGKSVS
jgi:hypothetical protein